MVDIVWNAIGESEVDAAAKEMAREEEEGVSIAASQVALDTCCMTRG